MRRPSCTSESFGYILSAVVGAGLILLVFTGLSWLMGRARVRREPRLRCARGRPWQSNPSSAMAGTGRHRGTFVDRLADGIAHALAHALDADDFARRDGFLQKLDPRVKLGIVVGFIVVAVMVKSLAVLAGLFLLAVALALASGIAIARLAGQVWIGVLAFTGLIALPALFLVPGDVVLTLPLLGWPVTLQGVRSAAFLTGRSETTATYALLLILSTPWAHLLKAMRAYRLPVVLVVILGMTYRYVFVLAAHARRRCSRRGRAAWSAAWPRATGAGWPRQRRARCSARRST